jgi:hypothetical protein
MIGSQLTDSAISVRARCSRMIWETATWVGVLLASTAGLFGFLTGESIQIHATSVLVLGIIPAAVVLVLAVVLVSLLRFLGTIYDFLRTALAYGFASCGCLGTAFHTGIVHFHELNSCRVLARAANQLVQATMAGVVWTGHLLKGAGVRARNGSAFVVQEVVLEVVWAKQVAARLTAIMPFMTGWPIRTFAGLLLRFINWRDQTAISQTREVGRSADRAATRLAAGKHLGRTMGTPSRLRRQCRQPDRGSFSSP